MIDIKVSEQIKTTCPHFLGVAIYAQVENTQYCEELWAIINKSIEDYRIKYNIEDIKKNKAILSTRQAYKLLGKDPNRYRPSAEALCRRIVRGIPLYQVDTLVDIINLVSIETGYSIGGFDANKIVGDELVLGVGMAEEPYEAIGRGMLNIEGLPVYRDRVGGVGTPTSDNERTKIEESTTSLLTIINGYSGREGMDEAVDIMLSLLRRFANSKDETILYF